MFLGDVRDRVCVIDNVACFLLLPLLDVSHDALADGGLGGLLAHFGQVRAAEPLGLLRQFLQVQVRVNRGFLQGSFDDRQPGRLVRARDLDQLVQPPWSHESVVQNLGSVSSTHDEHIGLLADTVHFGQQLINYTVTSTAAVTAAASATLHTN